MKLSTVIILSFLFFQVTAEGYSQTVTIKAYKLSLFDILKQINKQTGIQFTYSQSTALASSPITIELKRVPVREALDRCMVDQPLAYRFVDDKTIFIFAKPMERNTVADTNSTKVKEVNGKVVNERGLPLIGASIQIKNKSKGTQTDIRGEFNITNVDEDDLMAVSFTGYTPQQIRIGEKRHFVFELKVAVADLDKVIIQGYGTTTKRFSTGNITTVTAEEIGRQPVTNPLLAIQGRVPGVVVSQANGFASAPVKIEIRGRSTLNPQLIPEPLYIVDGVPLTVLTLDKPSNSYGNAPTGFNQNGMPTPALGQSPFFSINPADIESITVLKDADATAIYGSRGGNGVIIITTKSGKSGRNKLEFTANSGVSFVSRFYDMLNTKQYVEMRKEALANDGFTPSLNNAYDLVKWDTTKYTDFQKVYWGSTANYLDFNLGISGGERQTIYSIGLGYLRRSPMNRHSGSDQRGSLQFNLQSKSTNQKLSFQLSTIASYAYSDMISVGVSVVSPPNSPPIFDDQGKFNFAGWRPLSFPFKSLAQPYSVKTFFINTNLRFEYIISKGLSTSVNLGFSTNNGKQRFVFPLVSMDIGALEKGTLQLGNNSGTRVILEPQINYSTRIGSGDLSLMGGTTYQSTTQESELIIGSDYETDDVINTLLGAKRISASNGRAEYKYAALFGRLNYVLLKRYMVNISGRRDGSSRFGPGKQFGNFGAIGIGWIISEAHFMRNLSKTISFAKLRASYGIVGSDLIGDYAFLTRWQPQYQTYQNNKTLIPIQHANPDLQWQSDKKLEVGIDLGFLNNKFNIGLSLYRNRIGNQLLDFNLPVSTGFASTVANFPAILQNSGIELILKGRIIENRNIGINWNFNIGSNNNKLISYPDLDKSPYVDAYVVGESASLMKVLHYTGVDPQSGTYTFWDLNKDGKISVYSRVPGESDNVLRNMSVRYDGSFGSDLRFKGWELSFQFYFRNQPGYGVVYYDGQVGSPRNYHIKVLDRWQKPGDIVQFSKYSTLFSLEDGLAAQSDRIIANASFIRLNNLAITYTVRENWCRRNHLSSIRLFLRCQNLLLFTGYEGPDPEVQQFGALPLATTITGGLSISL